MQGKNHQEKSVVRYTVSERESGSSRKHKIDKQQSFYSLNQSKMEEKQLHTKDENASTTEIKSLEGNHKGNKQVSIKHFLTKKGKNSLTNFICFLKRQLVKLHIVRHFSVCRTRFVRQRPCGPWKLPRKTFFFGLQMVYLNCSRECFQTLL